MDWEEDDYWYLTPVDHPSKEELEWDEKRIQQPHEEEEIPTKR